MAQKPVKTKRNMQLAEAKSICLDSGLGKPNKQLCSKRNWPEQTEYVGFCTLQIVQSKHANKNITENDFQLLVLQHHYLPIGKSISLQEHTTILFNQLTEHKLKHDEFRLHFPVPLKSFHPPTHTPFSTINAVYVILYNQNIILFEHLCNDPLVKTHLKPFIP